MEFDLESTLKVLQIGGVVSIAVYLWLRRRHDRNAERIGALDASITELQKNQSLNLRRISELETASQRHADSDNNMGMLLAEMRGRLEGIGNAVDLVVKHLVEKK